MMELGQANFYEKIFFITTPFSEKNGPVLLFCKSL